MLTALCSLVLLASCALLAWRAAARVELAAHVVGGLDAQRLSLAADSLDEAADDLRDALDARGRDRAVPTDR